MVIPVGDLNPTRRRPVVTVPLIVANVAVHFLVQPRGGCAAEAFLYEWAAVPRELTTLHQLGPRQLAAVLGPSCAATVDTKAVLLSALTAMFLHANVAHLIGNMLFLWVFGNNVEDRLGPVRFLGFYVLGGLVATAAYTALDPRDIAPLLGASGAVAAVLGAYLLLHPRARVVTYVPFPLYLLAYVLPGIRVTAWALIFAIVLVPAWLVLGGWFAFQVVAAQAPVSDGVAYSAHVAGFVAGMVLLLLLDGRRRRVGQAPYRGAG